MNYQASHDQEKAMPSEALRLRQGLLSQHIRNLSLPHSQPALYDTLNILLSTAVPLRQDMEESLDQLKEAFLNVVHDTLREGGVDLQYRLVLGFSEGRLAVVDRDHPQVAFIDALLAQTPMLASVLRQIATDTLMLRSLSVLDQAYTLTQNDEVARRDPEVENYQVCLKGPLSHFYYS